MNDNKQEVEVTLTQTMIDMIMKHHNIDDRSLITEEMVVNELNKSVYRFVKETQGE